VFPSKVPGPCGVVILFRASPGSGKVWKAKGAPKLGRSISRTPKRLEVLNLRKNSRNGKFAVGPDGL